MREQLEALIAELLADAASEPDRGCDDWDAGYQDGRRDARRNLADRLATALAADVGGWRPASDLPKTLLQDSHVVLWSAEHVIACQSAYPGGGWVRLFTVSEVWWPSSRQTFIKAGITHFRFPEPPPQEPPR